MLRQTLITQYFQWKRNYQGCTPSVAETELETEDEEDQVIQATFTGSLKSF